jgi:hypothetical protein
MPIVANDLTSPGGSGSVDTVYVRDIAAGTTTLVSVDADGGLAFYSIGHPFCGEIE